MCGGLMAKSLTILQHGYEKEEFEDLLTAAESGANDAKSQEFVEQTKTRFATYGKATFISEAQLAWLERLAK